MTYRGALPDFALRMQQQVGVDVEMVLQDYRDAADKVADAGRKIARLKADMAQLAARHSTRGQASHYDHERKAKLAEIVEARRAELVRAGEKVVEAALDSYGRANPAYLSFLEHGRSEQVQYEQKQAALSEAFAELELAKGVQAYLAARLDVIRAQMYAYGQEARLTPA